MTLGRGPGPSRSPPLGLYGSFWAKFLECPPQLQPPSDLQTESRGSELWKACAATACPSQKASWARTFGARWGKSLTHCGLPRPAGPASFGFWSPQDFCLFMSPLGSDPALASRKPQHPSLQRGFQEGCCLSHP